MSGNNQIFQTNSALRWKSLKWTSRIILFILLFVITVVVIAAIFATTPSLPNIQTKNKLFENALNTANSMDLSPSLRKKYKGFKSFLEEKDKEDSINKLKGKIEFISNKLIRAAFYDNSWTAANYLPDLEENASKLNTIFPTWFSVNPKKPSEIVVNIDSAGFAIMKRNQLKIIPILTNVNPDKKPKRDFDGSILHVMLNDVSIRTKFINNLADTVLKYGLQGINIDFEEITESTSEPLNNFQKQLYETFHAKGLLVTQDVIPNNDAYDYEKLNAYNDYIVLMAYDEHAEASEPGPISGQKWVEEMMDLAASKINPNKIIMGLADYGYDWSFDTNGKPLKDLNGFILPAEAITYSQALDKAKLSGSEVDFDNDNFNLHYNYTEEKDGEIIKHQVWFTAAPTTYNVMRFADEYGAAGTAFWVIGKEDRRIWNFYGRDLSNQSLTANPFNYRLLLDLPFDINQKPTKTGEGELLRILSTPQTGKVVLEIDTAEQLIAEQKYISLPSGYVYEKFAEDTANLLRKGSGHKIILTFDDGPSTEFTPKILSILEKENVPATFFVVGINSQNNIPLLQRIYKDGYEIGNHTYTHSNIAKMSGQRAELEMKSTRLLIEAVTGHSTILFRAPYNADSEPQTYEEIEPIARSKKDNYITVGEGIDPNDWVPKVAADSIVARTIRIANETNANVILLHDAGGESRQATVDALPRIIKYFKDQGCEFTTVAALMGKQKDEVMPPVKRDWKLNFSFYFTVAFYWITHFIFALFIVGIILSITRIIVMALLAFFQSRKEKDIPVSSKQPGVSIIVPAYNEEINAIRTIQSLLKQDYPNLQVVFVDDGSKDATYKIVSEFFADNPNVQVVTKANGGKPTALNYGINIAIHDYVVCIDADTQLKQDAISQLMKKFYSEPGKPEVGAVAGNVKVGNEINMITKWQSIEYTTSQNFDRSAFDYLNCITVIPGAIGAFKKAAVIEAGGFTSDTLAEDCDLTMRMHRKGYSIRNSRQALSYTEAPETLKQFMKQRFRWSFGVMQCFWKHRDTFFNPKYRNLGMVAIPNILIFQMILPFLAPLADIVLLLSLIAAGFGVIPTSLSNIIFYYFVFTFVDMIGAAIAFNFENVALRKMKNENGQPIKEGYKKLLWLIPQQLVYRQLMYYILLKSFNKAIKGELQGWGVLKRTGNVGKISAKQ